MYQYLGRADDNVVFGGGSPAKTDPKGSFARAPGAAPASAKDLPGGGSVACLGAGDLLN